MKRSTDKLNWGLIITCLIMMMLVHTQVFTFAGTYIIPVTSDFGISRSAFSTHISIAMVMCILVSFLYGKIFEKAKLRLLFIATTILAASCLCLYSFATKVWHFYLISVPMGYCVVALGNTAVSILISKATTASSRGKAMGFAMCGSGLGGMLLIPVINYINNGIGWRWSYRIMAAAIILFLLPLIVRNINDLNIESNPSTISAAATDFSVNRLMRKNHFWFLMLLLLSYGFSCVVLSNLGYTFFFDIGFSIADASLLASIISGSLMVGKLIMGAACDKIGHKRGFIAAAGLQAMSYLFAFFSAKISWLAFLAAVCFGAGNSLATVGVPLLIGDIYGEENYAKLGGIMYASLNVGNAIGPIFAAFIFDNVKSYLPVMLICFTVNTLAILGTHVAYVWKAKRQNIAQATR